jgi:hypothetical protein
MLRVSPARHRQRSCTKEDGERLRLGGAPASAMAAPELGMPQLKRIAAGGGRQAPEGGGSGGRPGSRSGQAPAREWRCRASGGRTPCRGEKKSRGWFGLACSQVEEWGGGGLSVQQRQPVGNDPGTLATGGWAWSLKIEQVGR